MYKKNGRVMETKYQLHSKREEIHHGQTSSYNPIILYQTFSPSDVLLGKIVGIRLVHVSINNNGKNLIMK